MTETRIIEGQGEEPGGTTETMTVTGRMIATNVALGVEEDVVGETTSGRG